MIPVVDQRACIGCGKCEALCPQVFRQINHKSNVVDPDGCESCDCEKVAESCKPGAITLYDDF